MWEAEQARLPLLLLAAEIVESLLTAQITKLEQLYVSLGSAGLYRCGKPLFLVLSSTPHQLKKKLLEFSVSGGSIEKGIAVWVCELLQDEDTQGSGEKEVRMVVKGGTQQNGLPSLVSRRCMVYKEQQTGGQEVWDGEPAFLLRVWDYGQSLHILGTQCPHICDKGLA